MGALKVLEDFDPKSCYSLVADIVNRQLQIQLEGSNK